MSRDSIRIVRKLSAFWELFHPDVVYRNRTDADHS
jgi:hypothetical protein